MGKLAILALIISSATALTSSSAGTEHFHVVCQNSSSAIITLDAGFEAENGSECTFTKENETSYALDDSCFPGKPFFIKEVRMEQNNVNLTVSRKAYNLTCEEPDGGVTDTISAQATIGLPTDKPAGETDTFSPIKPEVTLKILSTDPITSPNPKQTEIQTAQLGTSIHLSIVNEKTKNGKRYVIPLSCEASAAKITDKVTLWSNNCSMAGVMHTSFEYSQKGTIDYASAEMVAFQFQSDPTATITFFCTVRVCAEKRIGTQCEKDYVAATKCGNGTAPLNRRRRDVSNQDDSGQGNVHHLTASLHILDDVMTTGTSSSVYYTVTCFILPVLAMVVQ